MVVREVPWSVGQIACAYLAAVAVASLTGSVAAAVSGGGNGVVALIGGQLGLWLVLSAAAVFGRGPVEVATDGARRSIVPLDIPIGIAIGVATQLVLLPVLYWPLRTVVDADELSRPAEELLDGLAGVGLLAVGVGVVIVAPVVEELFFRGLLLRAMAQRWSLPAAVVGSSVFFGATHFQPLQFPGLTLAGLVFAAAVVRTNRIGTAITVHVGFNATTFVALVAL